MPSGDFRPPSAEWQQGYDAGYREGQQDAALSVAPSPDAPERITADVNGREYLTEQGLRSIAATELLDAVEALREAAQTLVRRADGLTVHFTGGMPYLVVKPDWFDTLRAALAAQSEETPAPCPFCGQSGRHFPGCQKWPG